MSRPRSAGTAPRSPLCPPWALPVVLACVVAAPAGSRAQVADVAAGAPTTPVLLQVGPLFQDGPLFQGDVVVLRVRLENQTGAPLDGRLELLPASGAPGAGGARRWPGHHALAVHLPARAVRFASVPVALDDGYRVDVRYVVDGARQVETSLAASGGRGGQHAVVLLPGSQALKSALQSIEARSAAAMLPGSVPSPAPTNRGPFAVGVVREDRRSGDPVAPLDPVGWATADTVIASIPSLLRLGDAALAALDGWVDAGGQLVLSPRGPGDLDHPAVLGRALPGEPTRYGTRRARGFGAVHVLELDVLDDAAVADPAGLALLEHLVDGVQVDPPRLGPLVSPLGRARDAGYARGGFDDDVKVRAGLDPNQRFRSSLLLVGALLLAYTVLLLVVGVRMPVRRWGAPLRVLVVTPALAMTFTAALLAVGYLSKGVRSRQHRFELVELPAGAARGPARRYTAIFPTRPRTFDWPAVSAATRFARDGAASSRFFDVVRHGVGEGPRFEGVRAGLWETRFVREDRLVSLDGAVDLEVDGAGRVLAISNGSSAPLTHAVVVGRFGAVVPVGAVPPGGRREVNRPARFFARDGVFGDADMRRHRFAKLLGLTEAQRPIASALFDMHPGRDRLVRPGEVVLYARLAPDPEVVGDDGFALDVDLRVVRVSRAVDPPPPTPGAVSMPTPVPYPLGSMP